MFLTNPRKLWKNMKQWPWWTWSAASRWSSQRSRQRLSLVLVNNSVTKFNLIKFLSLSGNPDWSKHVLCSRIRRGHPGRFLSYCKSEIIFRKSLTISQVMNLYIFIRMLTTHQSGTNLAIVRSAQASSDCFYAGSWIRWRHHHQNICVT